MNETSQRQFITVIYISVFALCINHLSAQNSVQFYSSSPSKASVPTTEQASVVIEQSQVASGRSIGRGSIRHRTINNNHPHKSERQLKTTGFAFKGRQLNDNGGQTSPIPFVIPSYASGIIFRNTDNDNSPPVQIQPAIDVATKTIGPEIETDEDVSARARPTTNVNSFKNPSTVTQTSVAHNEIQNNPPIRTVSTTLSTPLVPSQINTNPTIVKTTNEPRYSDINKRLEILGLQTPGYAVRNDGTIDSDALPPHLISNSNTNFASNNLSPLDFDATASTTTPRITRTTQHQPTLPTPFIPSHDNPFLLRKSKQNLNATPSPFTSHQSTTTQANTFKAFTTFATTTKSAQFAAVNSRNAHAIGNGFVSQASPTNPSPFSKNGNNPNAPNRANAANGQFGNQPNSRQSKNYNDLSFNTQQQSHHHNSQFSSHNSNLDNRARLSSFGIAETTTVAVPINPLATTTKRAQSFGAIQTAKAPAGFSIGSGFAKTTIKTTQRARIVPTTNAPTTFSTLFPSKYTFSTIRTTVGPLALSQNEPSIELLPPLNSGVSNPDAKSAFAAINEAGALVRSKSPAFLSSATANRNQQPQQQHQRNNNNLKPINNGNSVASKTNNGLPITITTKSPIQYRPVITTTPFKLPPTTTRAPTTTAAVTTTAAQHAQPNANAQEPYIDLLPPIQSDSSAVHLPDNDLLPPIGALVQSPNAGDASVAAAAIVHATTSTAGTRSNNQPTSESDLDLNPFLPPVDTITNPSSASYTQSNSENNNEYTEITLQENPFLPMLNLDPFLPPFIFTPSENDAGFGFGAGTPPSSDDTPESSNI